MKTLCVAVVVLSLTSVCLSAPLTCDKLLKPLEKSPDLSGRWYMIALSSDICLVPALLNSFFWPSIVVDITAQATPKIYVANFTFNMYDYCDSAGEQFFLKNNSLYDLDENNTPTGEPDVLLHTGCPDCFVIKGNDGINYFMLFSRRKTVTAAELKEFETQSECLGWSKPEIFNTDHEYTNCKTLDDKNDDDMTTLKTKMFQRIQSTYMVPFQCIAEAAFHYPNAAIEWFKEKWNSLW